MTKVHNVVPAPNLRHRHNKKCTQAYAVTRPSCSI